MKTFSDLKVGTKLLAGLQANELQANELQARAGRFRLA
jgi:hypothetical protein